MNHCITGKDIISKMKDTKEFEEIMIHTYHEAKSCLRAVHKYDLIPPHLDDLTKHHHELLEITKQYRGLPPHHHDSHSGMWIENHFIDHFLNKSITSFGGFVPLFVQWIDYDLHMRARLSSNAMFSALLSKLRHDVAYITVSQDNNGIPILIEKFPNVIILSAGGNGNIPIPLIMGDLPYVDATNKELSIEVGFYGNVDHGIRKEIFHELKPLLVKYNLANSLHSSPHWIELM